MEYILNNYNIYYNNNQLKSAAEVLKSEIYKRTGSCCNVTDKYSDNGSYISLVYESESDSEEFFVTSEKNCIVLKAHRFRGIIFAIGLILRKSSVEKENIFVNDSVFGIYNPSKRIRGHQLSYTDMNNTLDKWDTDKFYQYILELEMFGVNMIEADSGDKGKENSLMLFSRCSALKLKSEICSKLDMDFSVWCPMSTEDTDEETVSRLVDRFSALAKLDVVFIPGGDPGDLTAEQLFIRSEKIINGLKVYFPDVELWISAQAPHQFPDWGDDFLKLISEEPDYISGIIFGPNHPMNLDKLRREVPVKYPIRLYPDIGHNVCCEIPVHFDSDDWHFSFASTLNRECVNPRAFEFYLYNKRYSPYTEGSCTYSEGVNDDVNKFVWSLYEFDNEIIPIVAISDYCRFFFYNIDTVVISELITSLEKCWYGDPKDNILIDYTFDIFSELANNYPVLFNNWRFLLLLFRSYCDKIIRERRVFELGVIEESKLIAEKNDVLKVIESLKTPFCNEYNKNRSYLNYLADKLFDLIGIQLSETKYGGLNWERGCTLDTIDNPVTDRRWLLKKIISDKENFKDYFTRYFVNPDEYYFSFALHGFKVCGRQTEDYYFNFMGGENTEGEIPVGCLNVFDHFNFKTSIAGLTSKKYYLRITYKSRYNSDISMHRIKINDNVLYVGKQYGGTRDLDFERKFLSDGFQSVKYDIPDYFIKNGCITLEIDEPIDGFTISEFWIKNT